MFPEPKIEKLGEPTKQPKKAGPTWSGTVSRYEDRKEMARIALWLNNNKPSPSLPDITGTLQIIEEMIQTGKGKRIKGPKFRVALWKR